MRASKAIANVRPMFSLLNAKRKEEGGRLADAGVATRWLASVAAEPNTERAVITAALSVAAARHPVCTDGRVEALLLVDNRAQELQATLLEQYAAGAHRDDDGGKRIAADATAINRAVVVYCEALAESLAANPAGRSARVQSYRLLTRQLANVRLAMMLSTLRHEKWIPLRWEKVHRLYRHSLQHRLHEVGKIGGADPVNEGRGAEWEYIQILLMDQMNHGNLSPSDTWRAFEWLAAWGVPLRLTPIPPVKTSFAVLPNGRGGLSMPLSLAESGALWLDLSALVAKIDNEIERVRAGRDADASSPQPAAASDRISLLQKLRTLWMGPLEGTRRRERRITVDEAASVVFGTSATFRAVEQSSMYRDLEEIELHDVGAGGNVVTAPWTVADMSVSGCRLKGKARAGVGVSAGMLFAMNVPATGASMIGIVRRVVRRTDEEVEIGANILAANQALVSLQPIVVNSARHRRDTSHGDSHADLDTRCAALLLGPPPVNHAPRWTSVIVAAYEYRRGAEYRCLIGVETCMVTFGAQIERTDEYVLAEVRVQVAIP